MTLLILTIAALVAGFVDAVAGGGGLILLPTILITHPGVPFATLSGTNKIASVCGSFTSTLRYGRSITFDWSILGIMVPLALLGSWLGAATVTRVDSNLIRSCIPFALAGVFLYTVFKPELGKDEKETTIDGKLRAIAGLIALGIGFYDGLIGPGTGSFLIFGFVALLGLSFVQASGFAKVINFATNLAAVSYFVSAGHFILHEGLAMGAAYAVGSFLGAGYALKYGSAAVRRVFLVMVSALLIKLVYDQFLRSA